MLGGREDAGIPIRCIRRNLSLRQSFRSRAVAKKMGTTAASNPKFANKAALFASAKSINHTPKTRVIFVFLFFIFWPSLSLFLANDRKTESADLDLASLCRLDTSAPALRGLHMLRYARPLHDAPLFSTCLALYEILLHAPVRYSVLSSALKSGSWRPIISWALRFHIGWDKQGMHLLSRCSKSDTAITSELERLCGNE